MAINSSANCQPCAPVPSQPLAPPPSCPVVSACDEYIESDCVISSTEGDCVSVYIDPNDPQAPISVGLIIQEGVTTLTDVYDQLTSTACIFNPSVIGAVLQTIGDPTHPNYNATLNEIFCAIVCACTCDDACANVIPVSQAVYTNIDTDSFDITFLAQPDYQYQITINDSNSVPFTYYTWSSTVAPNLGNAPVPFTVNTSAFTKFVGTPPVSTNPPNTLASNTTFEVYINAENPNGETCPAGPWTVVTAESLQCNPDCDQIQISIAQDPAITTNLAFTVTFTQGPAFPVSYLANIYDSSGTNVIPVDSILSIGNAPVINPITNLYPTTVTNYDYPAIVTADDYTVEITPICSFAPLYCTGTMVSAVINFAGPASCSPPDIVSVQVLS